MALFWKALSRNHLIDKQHREILSFYFQNNRIFPDNTLEEMGVTHSNNIIHVVRTPLIRVRGLYPIFAFLPTEQCSLYSSSTVAVYNRQDYVDFDVQKGTTLLALIDKYCLSKELDMRNLIIIYPTVHGTIVDPSVAERLRLETDDDVVNVFKKKITVQIVGQDRSAIHFCINASTSMGKLFKEYCMRRQLDRGSAFFTYGETVIQEDILAFRFGMESFTIYAAWGAHPKVSITVKNGNEKCAFMVDESVTIRSIKEAYCRRYGLRPASVQFAYDSKFIDNIDQRVADLGVPSGSVLIAVHR